MRSRWYFRRAWGVFRALLFLLSLTLGGGPSLGQDFRLESIGARFGFGAGNSAADFHQADAFLNTDLPWRPNLGRSWFLKLRMDFSAGWLGDPGHDAAIGTAGPTFLFGRAGLPLTFELGSGPTLMSRYEFGTKNFGSSWQFTSHLGANVEMGRHVRLSYRLQHMSNAGLDGHNPGLNLHVFGVSYLF